MVRERGDYNNQSARIVKVSIEVTLHYTTNTFVLILRSISHVIHVLFFKDLYSEVNYVLLNTSLSSFINSPSFLPSSLSLFLPSTLHYSAVG